LVGTVMGDFCFCFKPDFDFMNFRIPISKPREKYRVIKI